MAAPSPKPAAIKPTYDNIAENLLPQIQTLTSNVSTKASLFLGPVGCDIIGRHFPANWLDKIRFGAMAKVPVPSMDLLCQAMHYPSGDNFKAFRDECDTIDKGLYPALDAFTHGEYFLGITWDTTISLQWAEFGQKQFLSKYIKGYVAAKLVYRKNPAEKHAFEAQDKFRDEANKQLKAAGLPGLDAWGAKIMAASGKGGAADLQKAIAALMNMTPLGITKSNATSLIV